MLDQFLGMTQLLIEAVGFGQVADGDEKTVDAVFADHPDTFDGADQGAVAVEEIGVGIEQRPFFHHLRDARSEDVNIGEKAEHVQPLQYLVAVSDQFGKGLVGENNHATLIGDDDPFGQMVQKRIRGCFDVHFRP